MSLLETSRFYTAFLKGFFQPKFQPKNHPRRSQEAKAFIYFMDFVEECEGT